MLIDNPQGNFTHDNGLDCPVNVKFMPDVNHLKTDGRDLDRGNEICVICFGLCFIQHLKLLSAPSLP